MTMHKQIVALVEAVLDDLAAASSVWRPEWITRNVCVRFEHVLRYGRQAGEITAPDFYEHCAYKTVRSLVTHAIRKRCAPGADGQLAFPEFPRVQAYYEIDREIEGEREWVAVPVLQLHPTERVRKVSELRRAAAGFLEHAEQLEMFFAQYGAA